MLLGHWDQYMTNKFPVGLPTGIRTAVPSRGYNSGCWEGMNTCLLGVSMAASYSYMIQSGRAVSAVKHIPPPAETISEAMRGEVGAGISTRGRSEWEGEKGNGCCDWGHTTSAYDQQLNVTGETASGGRRAGEVCYYVEVRHWGVGCSTLGGRKRNLDWER